MNEEPLGFANPLCEKKERVKVSYKVFISIVEWCFLTEMAKIAEGSGFGYGSEESRVLWPILEKDKELIYNCNEFVLLRDTLLYAMRFHFLLFLLACEEVLTKSEFLLY